MYTLREVFEKVKQHALAQNARALAPNGECAYRDFATGRSCFVGCLIKDEFYRPRLEYQSVYSDYVDAALRDSGVETRVPTMLDLLARLQSCHDTLEPKHWPAELDRIEADCVVPYD